MAHCSDGLFAHPLEHRLDQLRLDPLEFAQGRLQTVHGDGSLAVDGDHQAIQYVQCLCPEIGFQALPGQVQVSEGHHDLRSQVTQRGIGHQCRQHLFGLNPHGHHVENRGQPHRQ